MLHALGHRLQHWFPALAHPVMRRYMAGQIASTLGFWIQNVTISLLAWDLSHSPALLGTINFLLFGPTTVVSPLVGPHVHAGNARRLTIAAQGASFTVTCLLLALSLLHALPVAAIVVLAACSGVIAAVELPSRQVLLATSVSQPAQIANAIATNTLAFNLTRVVGPGIASALYATAGASAGFAVTAAAVGVMIRQLRTVPAHHTHGEPTRRPAGARPGLLAALRYVAGDRRASLFLPVVACLAILGGSYQTLVPVLADHVFHDTHLWTGLFFGATGVGALGAGGLLASRLGHQALRHLQVPLPWLVAVALAGLGATSTVLIALPCFALLGFALTFCGPGTNAALQQHAPENLRGALIGLYVLSFIGMMPLGHLLVGHLASWMSVQATCLLLAAALALALAALFVPRWLRHGRIVLDSEKI